MGYNTNSTNWPTAGDVPQPIKDLVDRFYNLLDDDSPEVGAILADEIFTPDATAYFGGQPFKGSEDIRISRAHAWKAIASRRHNVSKVYICKPDASDLLFIAHVVMGLRNGKEVEGEFCGRLTIADAQGPNPRLTLYQVWGDTSALVKALHS